MKRRQFLKTGLAVAAGTATPVQAQAEPDRSFYELRVYDLRNDIEPARMNGFFREHFIPAMQRQGIGQIGCFSPISGLNTPSLIVLVPYKSLGEVQALAGKLASDADYNKASKSFESSSQLPYVRYESSLLKAFSAHPKIELPDSSAAPHIFELRTYESKNDVDLAAKMDMFNQEEIEIFRKAGFGPVFFGETIFGTRLPHFTYSVAFKDMAARDKAWSTFSAHPDWVRIKDRPEWAGTVSNIHASFLRPTDYSQIR